MVKKIKIGICKKKFALTNLDYKHNKNQKKVLFE